MSAEITSPRLLVSVRSLDEALIARDAGTDLIDLKEPHYGSLGMADLSVAEQLAAEIPDETLSLALGELADWPDFRNTPRIPISFRYLKLGLSQQSKNPRWRQDWLALRQSVNERSGKAFGWIAVVYADADAACSPAPEEILEAARATNCAGVLFDTFSKSAGRLIDYIPIETLNSYIDNIHEAGMLTALAGGLRETDLPLLLPLGAEVIAVRGAVCDRNDRTAGVRSEAIASFQQLLNHPAQTAAR